MKGTLRSALVPAYLVLCILLGGSAQGIWGNMALQLIAIAMIGWSLLQARDLRVPDSAKPLLILGVAAVLLILIQLIPLPPSLWQQLPGRQFLSVGYELLEQPAPWLPISLAPYDTMASALGLLPPLAVLTAMLVGRAYRPGWLALSILVGTVAAILLGTLQVSSPIPTQSPWYLYRRTNHGVATGFFANSNHMATLLVVSLAFLAAFVAELRKRTSSQKGGSAVLLLGVGGVLVLAVGILVNGSLAAWLLGLPTAAICAVMLMPPSRRRRAQVAGLALLSAAAIAVVYLSPVHDRLVASNTTSFQSRQTFWSNSLPAVADNWLSGSGLGTFPTLYPGYENSDAVGRIVVNHAHNDYLELAMETGLPGIILLVGFLLWWARQTASVWRRSTADRFAQAATIASAVILMHSLVDYPLRTATMSAIFAACLALMAQPRLRDPEQAKDLWPTRHLTA